MLKGMFLIIASLMFLAFVGVGGLGILGGLLGAIVGLIGGFIGIVVGVAGAVLGIILGIAGAVAPFLIIAAIIAGIVHLIKIA